MITVGSDFSGVGAFDQALQRLGINYKTIFACDIDKYARQTYIENYGEPKYFPSNVYKREIPKNSLDIYMTSPPCQAFSLAGKRLGKDDKRGILFFNSHEFIQKNKPRYFIFENVKGLLSDDGGKTFREWINMLGGKSINGNVVMFPYEDSVPYHIYWKVLNAKDYGVPQNRERVFIIGIRDDNDNNFTFPAEEYLTKRLKDILDDEVDEKYFLSEKMVNVLSHHNNPIIENETPEKSACIHACYFKMGGRDQQYIKNKFTFADKRLTETVNENNFTNGVPSAIDSYNQSVSEIIAPTVKLPHNDRFMFDGCKIRRLTPRECFRLMDFPDSFTWPVSDSQAYKQAGNSIVVNVLYKIIKNLSL